MRDFYKMVSKDEEAAADIQHLYYVQVKSFSSRISDGSA